MDKAEYQAKLNELTSYVRDRDYESALMIVNEIDWKRVKSVRTLSMVADVYEANKLYDDAKRILQISLERSPASRTVLAQLTEVSLRLGEINDAERYYEQFNRVAGSDNAKYLLQYKLLKAKRAPLDAQIEVLKAYRELEYTEEWAYELASLYAKAGDEERCVAECDDMILWFGEGKYVLRALELKMKYEGLTPAQRKLYNEELARENAGMSSPLPVFERTASFEPVPEEIEPDEMKGRLRESFQEVFQGIRREPPREEEPVGKIDNTMSLDELHISELEPERPDTTVIETPESAETIVSIPDPKPVKETEKPEPEEEVKVWTDIGLRRRKTEEELAAEAVEKFDLDSLLKETAGSFSEEISSGDYEKTTDGDFLSSIPELESEDELEKSLNTRSTESGLRVDSDLPADAEAEPDTETADAAYPEDEGASWPEEEQSAADAEEILYAEPEEEADAPAGAEEAGDLQGEAEEADRQEEDAEALESSQEEAPPVPEKRGVVKALSGLFGAMTNRAGRQSGADRNEPKAVENTELPEAEEQTEAAQPAEALGTVETAEAQTSEDSAETVEEFREWTAEETAEPEEAAADELPDQTQEESAGEEEIASWGVGDTAETRPSWFAGDSGEPDNEPQAWAIGDVEETAEDVQDEPRREGAAAGFAAGASGVLAGAAGLAAGAAGATAGAAGAVAGMTGSAAGAAAGAAGSAVGAAAGAAGSAVGAAAGMAAGAAGLAAGAVSGGAETVNETAEPVKKYSAFAESIRKAVERQEAERKIRQAEEEKRRLKEELVAKAEAERHARDEADRLAREAEERRLQEEAERAARAEQERLAREEAERLAREAEERRLQEEAERQAREEAERQAREEAERQAREEAERQAREEAERQAREEAERQAREEAERQAREEAERQAREEAERQAREEAERQAREEAERQAREEAERQEREEAERQAREEAERQAREEAEGQAREEAECQAREAEERRLQEEAERQAREEAEQQASEEADESLASNAPAEEIDENEAAALAEALAAYDERLKAEEEADKTLAASGEDVRRRSAEPEEIDEKEAAALAEAAAAQLAVEIAAELSADFGEPAADLLPDASAAEEVTDSAKALDEAGLEAPAEAAKDLTETAEAPAEAAEDLTETAEAPAEAAAELPAEEAAAESTEEGSAEEAEISEPEMVEAPEQETLEAAGTSESEQAEISESEQVDVSESEQAEASESEQAEASESEQAEASDSAKEDAAPAAEADARKPRYNEELEVPDPEPTAKEKLSHSRTLDLSKVGENTVPVSLDEIISSETPEERRIRILHNEDQLRMNDEQRRIFTYFARIPGMDHQILSAMTAVYQHADEKTSSHGNLAIMGAQGSGKSKLAQNMISAMCLDLGMEAAKIARVTGYDMNKKDPAKIVDKMAGGFLIIEECSEMSSETVAKLGQAMDFRTDRMILIIEDEKAAMRGFLRQNPEFSKRIEKVISIPIFTNDELITFARTYAGENGYKLDDMAVLALYTIIGNNQSYESPMTISKVKTMVDEAITQSKHSPKRSRRGRRRGKDDGLLILQEKDFETT